MPVRPRRTGIDLLRVAAIAAIVAGHVWGSTDFAHLVFYPWHVPIFFFLSGYLWTARRSVRQELKKRNESLLKPYLFWGGTLYVLFLSLLFLRGTATPAAVVGPVLGGNFAQGPFGTFWFVTALFFAAIAWRLLELAPVAVRFVVPFAGLLVATFFGPILANTPLALGNVFPALFFVAAGELAHNVQVRWRAMPWPFALAGLALAGLLIGFGVSRPLDIKIGDWGTPIVSSVIAVIISWSAVVLAERWIRVERPWLVRAITLAALSGFTVVLLHPTIIMLGVIVGAPKWVIFILALLIPGAIGVVGLRSRMSAWMTGAPSLDQQANHRRISRNRGLL